MRRRWLWLLVIPALWAGIVALAGCGSPQARGIDPATGRLAPGPDSPNGVSSCDARPDRAIAPFAYPAAMASATAAKQAVLAALAGLPRTRVVRDEGTYIHATATSRVFRFVDDVEFLIVPDERLVHEGDRRRALVVGRRERAAGHEADAERREVAGRHDLKVGVGLLPARRLGAASIVAGREMSATL